MTEIKLVPYRSNYMPDLLAGQVQIVFNPIAQALPLLREGKLRALDLRKSHMSNGLQFDEDTSRKVEALYLTPDVVAQRGRVLRALELREGERVLDIGSGRDS